MSSYYTILLSLPELAPVYINKVLLEHSHVSLFAHHLRQLPCCSAELSSRDRHPMAMKPDLFTDRSFTGEVS